MRATRPVVMAGVKSWILDWKWPCMSCGPSTVRWQQLHEILQSHMACCGDTR